MTNFVAFTDRCYLDALLDGSVYYDFTAPAVSPDTTCSWKST